MIIKKPLQTAKREIIEETGLNRFEQLKLSENDLNYGKIVNKI